MSYRIYPKNETISFRKTTEKWGGLSNMARGFPLYVNDIPIQSSEILYQACRYPDYPEIQKEIITLSNPFEAKQVARYYEPKTRDGWEKNRVSIMKWCVRIKLCQNWEVFSQLLNSTGSINIVEHSDKDLFWGARRESDGSFYGMNVLGRILMETREIARVRGEEGFKFIPALQLDKFLLLDEPIKGTSSLKLGPSTGKTMELF
ncbi:NADAR family protein [Klebsiella michiganensis]|uniref:NADAR family protein n=1 Tax=Klebsiella michiganensis TaxID=1134687 RepID=UPI0025A0386E|nr:NADAR family protein [Klebsiella michiganensis]MDM7005950.1 NADAR family protein [Klebsiella michiganensis]